MAEQVDLGISMQAKVDFLASPDAYDEQVQQVEVIETHMSWVFLTEKLVYKLKKPVTRAYLELSTIKARKLNCDLETRLNLRLAPNIFLGVIPLTLNREVLALSGGGAVVDWLVKMRRLPADRMLDRLIKDRGISDGDIRCFTETMVRFYGSCRRPDFGASEYRRRLTNAIKTHRVDLLKYREILSAHIVEQVTKDLLHYLDIDSCHFDDRVSAGRIVEGHGDLRPEHICLDRDVTVFDCLEFSEELRTLDIADELAFLTLECERIGGSDAGHAIMSLYSDLSKDAIYQRVFDFYKASRALLRAKLAIWHLKDRGAGEHPKWRAQAERYLQAAQFYVGKL